MYILLPPRRLKGYRYEPKIANLPYLKLLAVDSRIACKSALSNTALKGRAGLAGSGGGIEPAPLDGAKTLVTTLCLAASTGSCKPFGVSMLETRLSSVAVVFPCPLTLVVAALSRFGLDCIFPSAGDVFAEAGLAGRGGGCRRLSKEGRVEKKESKGGRGALDQFRKEPGKNVLKGTCDISQVCKTE